MNGLPAMQFNPLHHPSDLSPAPARFMSQQNNKAFTEVPLNYTYSMLNFSRWPSQGHLFNEREGNMQQQPSEIYGEQLNIKITVCCPKE